MVENMKDPGAFGDSVFIMLARNGMSIEIQGNTVKLKPTETERRLTLSCSVHSWVKFRFPTDLFQLIWDEDYISRFL